MANFEFLVNNQIEMNLLQTKYILKYARKTKNQNILNASKNTLYRVSNFFAIVRSNNIHNHIAIAQVILQSRKTIRIEKGLAASS
jgi:hypothetical protein